MTSPESTSAAALVSAARLLLRAGRPFEARVYGHSMGSAICNGATVRIEPAAAAQLQHGEVIAFLKGDQIVAHRLVRRLVSRQRAERLLTLGDGNCFPDVAFELDTFLGRVVAVDAGHGWQAVAGASTRPAWVQLASAITTRIVVSAVILGELLRRR